MKSGGTLGRHCNTSSNQCASVNSRTNNCQRRAVNERAPISFVRRRRRAELQPIAEKIAEDVQFFNIFKAAIDGNDRIEMETIMQEVRSRAKQIDQHLSLPDRTRVIVILAELGGAFLK